MTLLPMSPTVTKLYRAKAKLQATGVYLVANEKGNNFEFVNEEAILSILRPHLIACKLDVTPLTYIDAQGNTRLRVTVTHVTSGEFMASEVIIPEPEPSRFSNGNVNYMGAEQTKAGLVTLWFRTLVVKLLGIPVYDQKSNAPTPQRLDDTSEDKSDSTGNEEEQKEVQEDIVKDTEEILNSQRVLSTYANMKGGNVENRLDLMRGRGVEVKKVKGGYTVKLPDKKTKEFWDMVGKVSRMLKAKGVKVQGVDNV